MPMQWHELARLRVDDAVLCHATSQPYALWDGVVVSVEPPAVGVYLPRLDTVVFPRLEQLHRDAAAPDDSCRYCRDTAGE